ncbi:hypothetical protein [Tepidibacillus marianensis]|uniref:hypothetical protein n=1 Tax=Tepidibacillus marianensis TaxID=3131995 RepID=UPI0030D60069
MQRRLPVLILALIILLQAFVPAVYAASENEAISSNIYLCPFDITSEGAGSTGYRYVSEGELNVIKKTGTIPNTDRAGNLKDVFVSPVKYNTVTDAEKGLQIGKQNPFGATESPMYRVEFNTNGIKYRYGGNVEGGTGVELITEHSIPVDLSKIFKLK